MKRTVWKYPVPPEEEFTVEMPLGSQVLSVQLQHGQPQMWALVWPEKELRTHRFRLLGTGHTLEGAGWFHVGTFQAHSGDLVFHLFEKGGAE